MPMENIDQTEMKNEKVLKFIEDVTSNAGEIQKRVLADILTDNAGAEYLLRLGLQRVEDFKNTIPIVSYEDLLPEIRRIANGDTSPILSSRRISEFLTSSGTSNGDRKLVPVREDEMERRQFFYNILMPVMSRFVSGLENGKGMYFFFVKSESTTPGGLPARPVLTSYYKSSYFLNRPVDPYTDYTSPNETVLCADSYQSMYSQLLCGLCMNRDVLRAGAVFASGFLRAVRFLETHWVSFCNDIRSGSLSDEITDTSVRAAVGRILQQPNPRLADFIATACGAGTWEGIIPKLWPNTKYIEVVVTGAMAQYVPALDYYAGGVPLVSPMYASSECYMGINLSPMCHPHEVAYTIIPTMAYFEFLPVEHKDGLTSAERLPVTGAMQLVDLVDVKLGHEYEIVVTTHSGLYRYRVGDILRVSGFKNKAPQFSFVCRKNVVLSIDSDKTDEVELHEATKHAAANLSPFGVSLVDYTSYADTSTIPGHYVMYWEIRRDGSNPMRAALPPSVLEDCCLAMEEKMNSVYRQGRAADRSIGALEIRQVEEGTFDRLMDYAVNQLGASINQYKTPRCVKFAPMLKLLDETVLHKHFSPKSPKWVPVHWTINETS